MTRKYRGRQDWNDLPEDRLRQHRANVVPRRHRKFDVDNCDLEHLDEYYDYDDWEEHKPRRGRVPRRGQD